MRKRVYIAGPISKGDLAHNVNRATAAFVKLAKEGLAPWCPHWSVFSEGCDPTVPLSDGRQSVVAFGTAVGAPGMSHADWLGIDLAWVGVADAVLRLPGESTGADMETAYARERGIPVFDTIGEVLAWAGGEATKEVA